MKLLMHVFHQPFIVTTGLAALLHSTWSLGTLFAGEQPPAGLTVEFVGWLAPALLLAFALDVGQIATSAEIRAGQRTRIKYITFIVFAAATYFLQWIYIAHHMPALLLGEGVRNDWQWMATLIRDAALWIIPAFLPLSTTLYTFSGGNIASQPAPESITVRHEELLTVQQSPNTPALPETTALVLPTEKGYLARYGEWEREYATEASAYRGLAGYIGRGKPEFSENGHGSGGNVTNTPE